ncbi:DEAD/DEAH box helicase [Orenia marismortui]|uniref:DEAD/DEAH box helicase domain-containing protein n=1 Tax=Orenia marismortui TaxID=46469 RepID=A0A4R8HFY8_9FIRM|nr:DEAD/DEAH box helicase [Orenia marismortui]TDX59020.1 DEAD/DEAH box helicase domain-containing protein [Orenia marismortui]
MIEVTVKKNKIDSCKAGDITKEIKPLIDYFQNYMGKGGKKADFLPYVHQHETFKRIMDNEEILLTAGTSAGKTLSHAIPLFYKIKNQLADKILLLYPTRALLQDQKGVMDDLAKIYGLEDQVAEIKGGMSRIQVIRALNKKIIIATPDSIYWFFNKNIKYSSFLIYGLAQVDEVVIDETHLFTGLVLNNLIFLINRMKKLAEMIDKEQRYHILTATANDSLRNIHKGLVDEISGKSNCGNIDLKIINKGDKFSGQLFGKSLKEDVVEVDQKLSSVAILNSAKIAHQLFYSNTEELKVDDLADDMKRKFIFKNSKITIRDFLDNIEEDRRGYIENKLKNKLNLLLDNILIEDYLTTYKAELSLSFDNEEIFAIISDYLEEGYRRIINAVERAEKDDGYLVENLDEHIARDEYTKQLYIGLRINSYLSALDEKEDIIEKIEKSINNFKEVLEEASNKGNKISIKTKKKNNRTYIELDNLIHKSGNKKIKYLSYSWILKDKLAKNLTLKSVKEENKKKVNFKNIKKAEIEVEILKEILEDEFNESWIESIYIPRYIATWKGKEDVLVVLYTGSMSNYVREGLIEFFNEADYKKKVLLSTSAVEVGVDFDCDLLITEETNVASFLQRFGRAGRSGKDSKVKLFVSEDSYVEVNNSFGEKKEISRGKFSGEIKEIFKEIKGIEDDSFLRAYHYIINQNLGRVGDELNQEFTQEDKELGDKLRGRINLNYGLRGTMASVSLRGGVTKNPFYILRFLENSDLFDSSSPFEIAYSDKSFDSIIWKSYSDSEDVYVNINDTLEDSKAIFIKEGKSLTPYFDSGVCKIYEEKFLRRKENYERRKDSLIKNKKLRDEIKKKLPLEKQEMLKYLLLSGHSDLILGFGNIYLSKDSSPIFVKEKPLFIPNQFFLLLVGSKEKQEDYIKWMKNNRIFDYSEVIVDDTDYENNLNEEHYKRNPVGVLLLENINGALVSIYEDLIEARKAGEL